MNENFAKTTTPLAYLEQSLDFDLETQKLYEIGRGRRAIESPGKARAKRTEYADDRVRGWMSIVDARRKTKAAAYRRIAHDEKVTVGAIQSAILRYTKRQHPPRVSARTSRKK